ncbi:MAG: 30S ribosomal protein S6 [Candidatus Dadabacteria bacterium]|nr:30S ribosomal protein S6 [Candidatus Dadabacteria bacterium]NIQ14961.1 30S ribosomal protein S6 [Candidatus Dadabacteria bacterium]
MAIKPKKYETLYLVRPDLKEEDLAKIQQKITDGINNNQGEIIKSEKWADRELAYSINDYTKGTYHILIYQALPDVVADIEKILNFHRNDVLRFMSVNYLEPQQKPKAEEKKPAEKIEQPTAENTAQGGAS